MRHLNKIASVFCTAALGMLTLTGCEGGDLYNMDSPDWISEKIDSINNSKNSGSEEELVGMMEDVYTIGNTDYTSGWWTAFSKQYVVPDGQKWNAVFNLSINPSDNTYYKNFALVICNDQERTSSDYSEYGAIRFDATGDSASYNSQWGVNYTLPFKFSDSNQLLAPVSNEDANVQKLGGKVTLTVDRSKVDTFYVKITNGTVTKTYTQPYKIGNLNADATNTNIRCFLVPEGSFITFQQTNIEPIGGCTSADDKQPLSMELANIPSTVDVGTPLDDAMQNVSAVVTFEEGVTQTVSAADLMFTAIPDMDQTGEKTLVAIYNKTFKGEIAEKPIVASATFKVVPAVAALTVTGLPDKTTYNIYKSAKGLTGGELFFNTTGLEVTATYVDGTTGVMELSNLNISNIPAKAGTQQVTITSENGTTTTVDIDVNEVEATDATVAESSIGLSDCTGGWWSDFITDVNVPAGEARAFTFTNYTAGASNWQNFVVILRNAEKGEYAVVRSDNYGWGGTGYNNVTLGGTQGTWADWLAVMNGAKVTVYVSNAEGQADVYAVMKGTDGKTYTQYYYGIDIDPDDLNVSFTVDGSYLVFDNAAGAKSYKALRHRK